MGLFKYRWLLLTSTDVCGRPPAGRFARRVRESEPFDLKHAQVQENACHVRPPKIEPVGEPGTEDRRQDAASVLLLLDSTVGVFMSSGHINTTRGTSHGSFPKS